MYKNTHVHTHIYVCIYAYMCPQNCYLCYIPEQSDEIVPKSHINFKLLYLNNIIPPFKKINI